MPRGNAAALNYEIPNQFIGQQAIQQTPNSVAPQNPIQNPAQLLAHREGLTKNYFDINSQLESYVTSMAKDYGLDVTKPDYTQPGGGEAFNTFNKLSSALLYTANDLARSAKIDDAILNQSAAGNIRLNQGYDPQTQLSSQMNPEEMFTPTKLDPQVVEANNALSKDFYTEADARVANAKIREPLINYYSQQAQQDPANAAYYQRQIAGLLSATKKTPYSSFQQNGRGGQGGNAGIAVLQKITNLSKGVWTPGTYKTTTRGGKTFIENNEMVGDSMGQYITYKDGQPVYRPKVVKSWLKDPDTGDVFIEYQDPQIPREKVSNQPGSAVTSTFMSNNSKYGDSAKMLDKADQLGILDDTGSSVDEALMPANYREIQNNIRKSGQEHDSKLKPIVNQTKEIINKIKDPTIGNNWNEFTLEDGRAVKVAKHRGKKEYYIKNWEDLFSGKQSDYENMSVDQIINLLDDPALGYFNKFMKPKETTERPKTVVQNGHTYTWNDATGQYE